MAQLAAIEINRPLPGKTASKRGKSVAPDFAKELETRKSPSHAEYKSAAKSAKADRNDDARPAKHADHGTLHPSKSKTEQAKPTSHKPAGNAPSEQAELQNNAPTDAEPHQANEEDINEQDVQSRVDSNTDPERELAAKKDDELATSDDRNATQLNIVNIINLDAPPAQMTQPSIYAEAIEPGLELTALEISGTRKAIENKEVTEHTEANAKDLAQTQAGEGQPGADPKVKEKIAQPNSPSEIPIDQKEHTSKNMVLADGKSEGEHAKVFEKNVDPSSLLAWSAEHYANALSPDRTLQAVPQQPALDATQIKPVPYSSLPIEIGLRALDGAKEISIDLRPKELGQLNVTINVSDQSAIQISFQTENAHTLALLQHDASHIRHALEQAGYSTTDSSLQFSLRQDHSSNSNSDQGSPKKSFPRKTGVSATSDGELPPANLLLRRLRLSQLDLSV